MWVTQLYTKELSSRKAPGSDCGVSFRGLCHADLFMYLDVCKKYKVSQ